MQIPMAKSYFNQRVACCVYNRETDPSVTAAVHAAHLMSLIWKGTREVFRALQSPATIGRVEENLEAPFSFLAQNLREAASRQRCGRQVSSAGT